MICILFSDVFNVDKNIIKDYGAINISLVADLPLFIDPMLIFNSSKKEYKKLHNDIIKYFNFLAKKANEGLQDSEINAWFNFSEIPNNWLGYSMHGNKGLALGKKYAYFLSKNIAFAIKPNDITKGNHVEKVMFLYDGSGKDKISDLTVNLIKGFLCEYTESFSKKYLNNSYIEKFYVEKADFNYKTESYISKEYELPYIIIDGKKEFVLLTPADMLRQSEPTLNKKDCLQNYARVRDSIDNQTLRAIINNYLSKAVNEYTEKQKRNKKRINERTIQNIEKAAFETLLNENTEIYDYYIKIKESESNEVSEQCSKEREEILDKFLITATKLQELFLKTNYNFDKKITAKEEAISRIKYFKHIIEDCDGYKNLYFNNEAIANENDLQRLFRFVWYGTEFKVTAEGDNGRGRADFIISKSCSNQNIVEFKLASNPKLKNVFQQVEIYEKANCTDGSLIVIFYFSKEEYNKSLKVIKNAEHLDLLDKSIFLIDCRKDNKISASKV